MNLYELQDNKHLYLHQLNLYGIDADDNHVELHINLYLTNNKEIKNGEELSDIFLKYNSEFHCIGYHENLGGFTRVTGLDYDEDQDYGIIYLEINSLINTNFEDSSEDVNFRHNPMNISDNIVKIF